VIVVLKTGDPVEPVGQRRGSFARMIREAAGDAWSGEWAEHDVRTEAPLPDLAAVSAYVLTGSSANVPDRLPWMLRTEEHLRAAAAHGTPMLGLCFGHQILAQALGGEVVKNPRGREIGTVTVHRTAGAADAWLDGAPASFPANASHIDTVARLPPGARRLGTTSLDENAIFAVGAAIRGVQFHPEFDADITAGYVAARTAAIASEGLDAAAIARHVRETPESRALVAGFIRTFVTRRE
jgi:GMP synthase (glutamine-hydrolysing)